MRIPLTRLLSCAFLSFTLLPLASPAQGAISPTTSIPASALQEDVAIFRATFEQLHPGLYRYNTKEQMDAAFDRLRDDFSHDQTLEQTFVRLSRFTAQIRCGHTLPSPYNQSKEITAALFDRTGKLPFLYRWIGLRMIVTRDFTPEHSLPAGTEILAINGTPAGDVLKRLLLLVSADGANDAKRIDLAQEQGEADYEAPDVYLPMIFPGWDSPFRMRVKRPGSKAIASVKAVGLTTAERKSALAAVQPDSYGSQPLFTLRYLPDGAAVLTMPTWVMFHSKWDWKTWLNASLDEVIERKSPALILDLRGNIGGDDVGALILARLESAPEPEEALGRLVRYRKVPSELLPYLSTWDKSFKDWGAKAVDLPSPWPTAPPLPYFRQVADDEKQVQGRPSAIRPFKGKVYVLTDASNSSATFGFARTIQDEHLGVLVGKPTGGNKRGINGGAFFFLTLPHSGLEIDLPLIGYFPVQRQLDEGLLPDIPVSLSQRDIAASYDPVLAKVERLAASSVRPAHRCRCPLSLWLPRRI
jgi:hypothetical protein